LFVAWSTSLSLSFESSPQTQGYGALAFVVPQGIAVAKHLL
jgi:hypothetical protein